MRLALTGARVWDGLAADCSERLQTIVITDGCIETILEDEALQGLPGSRDLRQIALGGRIAMPGLIDAHVHLGLDPGLLSPAEQMAVPKQQRSARMELRALSMLAAGITTARDLGGADHSELRLRDRIASGAAIGPRLLCAGQPVTTPGGHCHFWGGEAAGPRAQASVVRRQLDSGVDWIKLMATGGVFTKGSGVATPQFDAGEIRAMVELASQEGRPVAAHCHGTRGIENAAHGGVRTIEHCSFAGQKGFGTDFDAALVELLAECDLVVSPTVNAGWGRRLEHEGRPSKFFERMSGVFSALRGAGIPLIASTDAGIPGVVHSGLAQAIVAFARYADLSPLEALRSATSESARGLGLDAVCGTLKPGLSADILVPEANPFDDLAALEEPYLVVAAGRVVDLAAL